MNFHFTIELSQWFGWDEFLGNDLAVRFFNITRGILSLLSLLLYIPAMASSYSRSLASWSYIGPTP